MTPKATQVICWPTASTTASASAPTTSIFIQVRVETITIDIPSLLFEIPLGALIPVRMKNLLPACKNIGTTHITNGCYRLHPVKWNVGEAAGILAAFCIQQNVQPRQFMKTTNY